jgi:GntR family transcriptional regulator, sialic acid-inducible nan operon repressor
MFAPVHRRKLFQDVSSQIAAAISSGSYPVGSALPSERQLMREFNVGRPAVREALVLLESRGLVTIRHGTRARVADGQTTGFANWIAVSAQRSSMDSNRFVDDLKGVRLALEVGMAARAAEIAGKRDIIKLTDALEANRRAISNRDDYLRSDIAFHQTIAAITGNQILVEMSAAILEWLARFRIDTVSVEGANLLSHDEHAAIHKAIVARNPAVAAEAMRRHQLRTHALYRHLIDQQDNRKKSASTKTVDAAEVKPRRKVK